MPREQYPPLSTLQFTWVSSVTPDANPILKITDTTGTVTNSITSVASGSTSFYALYTPPNTEGVYKADWYTTKTIAGSARPFTKSFLFNIVAKKRTI